MRKERVAHPGLDLSRPTDDERHSCASFKTAVLAAPEVAPWLMIAQERYRLIGIAIIHYRTIVAGQDDQCLVADVCLVERIQYLAYCLVKLQDGIAAIAHTAFPCEFGIGETGYVNVVGSHIEEEGSRLMLVDESGCLGCD